MKALHIKPKLQPATNLHPKFSIEIQNTAGEKIKVADPRATRSMLLLMNQRATIGGAAAHWGGPSALAETMSALFAQLFKIEKWYDAFHFVNDVGHAENGLYALRANYGYDQLSLKDLDLFRSIKSKLTGHGECHLNPESILISNGPLGSGLPQAQGLAIADKVLNLKRQTICILSDGAAMEGEAKESFATIPGLAGKNKINPFLLIISDNNTKLGGRIDKDSFSMQPTFDSLSALGWNVLTIQDGHNLQELYQTIEKIIAIQTAQFEYASFKPTCLIVKTIKGKGLKLTEEAESGGHGYPFSAYDERLEKALQEIYGEESIPEEFTSWCRDIFNSRPMTAPAQAEKKVITEKVQDGIARALIDKAKSGSPIYSLSSDLQSSTGLKAFHKAFPDRYLDLGIQESNMVSSAIGLSKVGLIPIVDTFAQFGITKGNLPLIMASLSEGPIIAVFSHTGFQDAADGASHQATTYLSALSNIPHVNLVVCSCSDQAYALMSQVIEEFEAMRQAGSTPPSTIFFIGRESHPKSYIDGIQYHLKKAQQLTEGQELTLVAIGPMVQKAMKAYEQLKQRGSTITVIDHPNIGQIDLDTIASSLKKTKGKLVVIEDHQEKGGFGQMLCYELLKAEISFQFKSLSIKGAFGQSAYTADELYARFNLSSDGIIKTFDLFQS